MTTPLNVAPDLLWPGAEAGAVAQGEPYLGPELWSLFPERLDAEGKPEGWVTELLKLQIGLRCGSFLTAPYRLASCGWPQP